MITPPITAAPCVCARPDIPGVAAEGHQRAEQQLNQPAEPLGNEVPQNLKVIPQNWRFIKSFYMKLFF